MKRRVKHPHDESPWLHLRNHPVAEGQFVDIESVSGKVHQGFKRVRGEIWESRDGEQYIFKVVAWRTPQKPIASFRPTVQCKA